MRSRVIGTLFALPFLAIGIWMLWSLSSACHDAWQMSRWQPAEAQLLAAGYVTNSGDDSETFEAYARYTYEYAGRTHTGERVSIAAGGDNIGDFQRNLGSRLSDAMARGEPITVWVDPENPAASVIDRSFRWGLMGFKCLFLLVFGGIGLGLLIAVWQAPTDKDRSLPIFGESPWLLNDQWQTASIRSSSRAAMWGAWAFATFWCLISAALPFLIYEEFVEKQNNLALIGLLFPLVGIGLLIRAFRRTQEWRRFGATPVLLDPFPGSIGGHVGGSIESRIPFDSRNRFLVTLTCLQRESQGGGNRRNREKAGWQCAMLAHTESGPEGTRLSFRFDVPEGLRESDALPGDDGQTVWRLNVEANLPATNLDRFFDIPVYATATRAKDLADRSAASAATASNAEFDRVVRDMVQVEFDGVRKKIVYPIGRHLGASLAGLIVGAVFAAAGAYLVFEEGARVFGAIFGGAGVLVAAAALYLMLNSLEVSQQSNSIQTTRRWIGLPVYKRQMRRSDFLRFEAAAGMQTQSGNKFVQHYKVQAIDRHGNKLTLGEGFHGKSGADAAIRLLSRELGLDPPEPDTARNRDVFAGQFASEL